MNYLVTFKMTLFYNSPYKKNIKLKNKSYKTPKQTKL